MYRWCQETLLYIYLCCQLWHWSHDFRRTLNASRMKAKTRFYWSVLVIRRKLRLRRTISTLQTRFRNALNLNIDNLIEDNSNWNTKTTTMSNTISTCSVFSVCVCLSLHPLRWAHSLWRFLGPQLGLLFSNLNWNLLGMIVRTQPNMNFSNTLSQTPCFQQ